MAQRGVISVTKREASLVRQQAEVLLRSYAMPGVADDKQEAPEWHEGKELERLADRMDAVLE